MWNCLIFPSILQVHHSQLKLGPSILNIRSPAIKHDILFSNSSFIYHISKRLSKTVKNSNWPLWLTVRETDAKEMGPWRCSQGSGRTAQFVRSKYSLLLEWPSYFPFLTDNQGYIPTPVIYTIASHLKCWTEKVYYRGILIFCQKIYRSRVKKKLYIKIANTWNGSLL